MATGLTNTYFKVAEIVSNVCKNDKTNRSQILVGKLASWQVDK